MQEGEACDASIDRIDHLCGWSFDARGADQRRGGAKPAIRVPDPPSQSRRRPQPQVSAGRFRRRSGIVSRGHRISRKTKPKAKRAAMRDFGISTPNCGFARAAERVCGSRSPRRLKPAQSAGRRPLPIDIAPRAAAHGNRSLARSGAARLILSQRHACACRGYLTFFFERFRHEDVHGRDKPGHRSKCSDGDRNSVLGTKDITSSAFSPSGGSSRYSYSRHKHCRRHPPPLLRAH